MKIAVRRYPGMLKNVLPAAVFLPVCAVPSVTLPVLNPCFLRVVPSAAILVRLSRTLAMEPLSLTKPALSILKRAGGPLHHCLGGFMV